MALESLLVLLIVGAIAGWLAGQIVRGFGFGLIGNIIVGIVGAVIAGWLFPQLGINLGGGIISSGIYFQELDGKDKPLSEAFMFFTVRYPAVERADGAPSKPFWEVRFVRQIHIPRSI